MKRLLILLLLCSSAYGQRWDSTKTSDTPNQGRTKFNEGIKNYVAGKRVDTTGWSALTRPVLMLQGDTLWVAKSGVIVGSDSARVPYMATSDSMGSLSVRRSPQGGIILDSGATAAKPAIVFETNGLNPGANWRIFNHDAQVQQHDHILTHAYNLLWNNATNSWAKEVGSTHAIRFGFESRYHATDPVTYHGMFEWNLDIDTSFASGTSYTAHTRPWFFKYDLDNHRTSLQVGYSNDTDSDVFSTGMAYPYNFTFQGNRNSLGEYGAVFGGGGDVTSTAMTGRLGISYAGRAFNASDRAGWISMYDGSDNASLCVDAGKDSSDAVKPIALAALRRGPVNIGTLATSGNAQLDVNNAGLFKFILRLSNEWNATKLTIDSNGIFNQLHVAGEGANLSLEDAARTVGLDFRTDGASTQPNANRPWVRIGGESSESVFINAGKSTGGIYFNGDSPSGVQSKIMADGTATIGSTLTATKLKISSIGAVIDSAKVIADTLAFYVGGVKYKAVK
jgi:hypothetical protein